VRMITATGFFSIAAFLVSGLFGVRLGILEAYVPSRHYASSEGWIEEFEKGLAEAKKTGKPIFVDFTGYTCTNCRLMEENMFPQPQVEELLSKYVRIKLHTDGRKNAEQIALNKANQKLQQDRYKTTALPFYAILSPDGKDVAQFDEGLTYDVDKFAGFLKSGLEAGSTKVATSNP
jgi:thiol:disulfide interchange protein